MGYCFPLYCSPPENSVPSVPGDLWKFTLQYLVKLKVPNHLHLSVTFELMTSQLVITLHDHFIEQAGDVLNQFMTKLS